jgi:hypothetical protein
MSALTSHDAMDGAETRQIVRAGLLGGLVGGITRAGVTICLRGSPTKPLSC